MQACRHCWLLMGPDHALIHSDQPVADNIIQTALCWTSRPNTCACTSCSSCIQRDLEQYRTPEKPAHAGSERGGAGRSASTARPPWDLTMHKTAFHACNLRPVSAFIDFVQVTRAQNHKACRLRAKRSGQACKRSWLLMGSKHALLLNDQIMADDPNQLAQ